MTTVDVIIPVYRPDEKLEVLINRLNEQSVQPENIFFMQTLVGTDEDDQVEMLLNTAKKAKIVPIKKKDFDHGGTRNLGASMSKADYMLFMTQDAQPTDEYLIENLKKVLDQDERISTAYGRQLQDDKVGIIEAYTRKFNYPEESSIKSKKDIERLGIKTYFCSNVCAMYRRKVYEELGGFVLNTIFNEDMIYASKVIQSGYSIAYVSQAKVVHAHKYTYRQQFTRNFDMAVSRRQYREIFDELPAESEGIRLVKSTMKYLFKEKKGYLIFDLIFQSGFKYMGYFFGSRYDKLPMWLVKKFSMNKGYWND